MTDRIPVGTTVTVPFGTGRINAEAIDNRGPVGHVLVLTSAENWGDQSWMSVPTTDVEVLSHD